MVALIRGAPAAAEVGQQRRGGREQRRGHVRARLARGGATLESEGTERLLRTRTFLRVRAQGQRCGPALGWNVNEPNGPRMRL